MNGNISLNLAPTFDLERFKTYMNINVSTYKQLSLDNLYHILQLRSAVFVVEQNCPYQDLDNKDIDAFHMTVYENELLIGTLRILKKGVSYNEVSIGRVASHPHHREKKLGHSMMKEAMKFIEKEFGTVPVRISAQSHLCDFYEKHGFTKTGKEYLEDEIPHSEMLYQPPFN